MPAPNSQSEHARSTFMPGRKALLESVLDSIEEPMLVVEGPATTVQWFNEPAYKLFPQLSVGCSMVAISPLLCDAIKQGMQTNGAAAMPATIETGLDKHPVVHCTRVGTEEQHMVLRLPDTQIDNAQLQKYMADRERLFTTSRTISVSEMATTLAHEINQPIGSIANLLRGTKARLEKMGFENEDILTALEKALDQSHFASRIIARIRDFTHSRQPKRVQCDVHELLSDSISLLDWVLAQATVKVRLNCESGTLFVDGDATMLQQIFTNLIRNAVEAMGEVDPARKHLLINVEEQSDSVQIEIADTGHGLSEDAQENLFVPFVTQKTQGMGVGLNICRSFVELHQGRLWLAPNDQAGCSSFVTLPLSQLNRR